MVRWPRLGRAHEVWPGLSITGVVILASAVLADALGDPPRGGARLYVGLGTGLVILAAGYVFRHFEQRRP